MFINHMYFNPDSSTCVLFLMCEKKVYPKNISKQYKCDNLFLQQMDRNRSSGTTYVKKIVVSTRACDTCKQ